MGALRDLEPKLLAARTALDLKGCIDVIRTIFEEIVEDAAKTAATLTQQTLPTGKLKDFQPWKGFLITANVLTAEEADLFQKLYNYMSNVATHRLGSQREHVRIAKNTVIEWACSWWVVFRHSLPRRAARLDRKERGPARMPAVAVSGAERVRSTAELCSPRHRASGGRMQTIRVLEERQQPLDVIGLFQQAFRIPLTVCCREEVAAIHVNRAC